MILALILGTLVINAIKGQRTIAQNDDFNFLRSDISRIFKDTEICGNAFRNNTESAANFLGGASDVDRIRYTTSTENKIIAQENTSTTNGLHLTEINLEYQKDENGVDVPPILDPVENRTTHWVNLKIVAEIKNGFGDTLSNIRAPFHFGVVTNATGQIVNCVLAELPKIRVLQFVWVLKTSACPKGFIDAQITDDGDGVHDLNENDALPGRELKLCAHGLGENPDNIGWHTDGCKPGYRYTGIKDDNDDLHALYESGNSGDPAKYWCMKGLQSVEWTGTCRPGYTAVGIHDDGELDDGHWIWEGSDDSGGFQLCVK
ncbi:MAG: hypothetical protein ACAH59_10465 [Pseudobdellovibrionaceae bacterium]